jgi:TRAP-type C4-dicarboxylate transport system permease small subunit
VIDRIFLTVPRLVVGMLFFLTLGLNFANVVGRYLFSSPIMSAEEILTYCMIWCIFLGAVLVTWEGRHLRMDLLFLVLPPMVRRWLSVVSLVVVAVVCLMVAVASVEVVALIGRNGENSVVAGIPMVIPYFVLPLGFGLMSLAIVVRFRTLVRDAEAGRSEITDLVEEHSRIAS